MKEFCSLDSDWFVLIEEFKTYVDNSITLEIKSLKTIFETCLRLKTELKLMFTDSRQWQYFHLFIYTKVLQGKQHSKHIKKQYHDSFRYHLVKYMRNIENCMQDVFSEIK